MEKGCHEAAHGDLGIVMVAICRALIAGSMLAKIQ
jgi:hypothetical protein